MGWLIAAGVVAALWFMPTILRTRFDSSGAKVTFLVGVISIPLYPVREKKGEKGEQKKQNAGTKTSRSPGKLSDLKSLADPVVDLLQDLRRKLVIKRLDAKLVMAGDDPCDLAVNYGKAWAVLGSLFPMLENVFVIKKRDVEIQCDFTAEETMIRVRADIGITLGRLMCLVFTHGLRIIKEYTKIKNKKKGGT